MSLLNASRLIIFVDAEKSLKRRISVSDGKRFHFSVEKASGKFYNPIKLS
jgi:hypothetical protein